MVISPIGTGTSEATAADRVAASSEGTLPLTLALLL